MGPQIRRIGDGEGPIKYSAASVDEATCPTRAILDPVLKQCPSITIDGHRSNNLLEAVCEHAIGRTAGAGLNADVIHVPAVRYTTHGIITGEPEAELHGLSCE